MSYSVIMLLCIAKEVLFQQTALCSKQILHTEVSSQLFYSLSIMLSTVNYLDEVTGMPSPRLPYIFVHLSTGHTFQLKQIG